MFLYFVEQEMRKQMNYSQILHFLQYFFQKHKIYFFNVILVFDKLTLLKTIIHNKLIKDY